MARVDVAEPSRGGIEQAEDGRDEPRVGDVRAEQPIEFADRLEQIGLAALRTRELILADGRRDRRLLGEALFTLRQFEETLTCPVVFAPKESLYLLGATALENFGVDVDPANKRLKPILGIIGGFLASR